MEKTKREMNPDGTITVKIKIDGKWGSIGRIRLEKEKWDIQSCEMANRTPHLWDVGYSSAEEAVLFLRRRA